MKYQYIIRLAPATKKNSQVIAVNKNTGKLFIAQSKQYREYEKAAAWYITPRPEIDRPVNVKCLFFLPDRRRRDLTNLLEAVDDILVKYKALADDNYLVIVSHDGSRCYVDRENPRTEIYIETIDGGDSNGNRPD